MKKPFFLILLIFAVYLTYQNLTPKSVPVNTPINGVTTTTKSSDVLADKLQIPWALAFLPDQTLLFTERSGRLRSVSPTGVLAPTPIAILKEVKSTGEGGLLGLAVHPNFTKTSLIYLYYTYAGNDKRTLNKVVRFLFKDNKLSEEKILVSAIPGNSNHNGGRLKFGPDGFLYITTGDSQDPSLAQDKSSLAGKILRVTDDGEPAPGNPFGNEVYSYGHRNPQGLAWDEEGHLWSTEHGSTTGDEINLIEKGKNFGWPDIRKSETKSGMVTPVLNSENDTWAPSGLVYIKPFLYFAGLRSNSLYRLGITTMKLDQVLSGKYGRLREVVLGPDGFLYLTTSNMDGRSLTHLDGDKILRLDPTKL